MGMGHKGDGNEGHEALHQQTWAWAPTQAHIRHHGRAQNLNLHHDPPLHRASSSPPAAFLAAAFKSFLFTLPGRPPPKGHVLAKPMCFCGSTLTDNGAPITHGFTKKAQRSRYLLSQLEHQERDMTLRCSGYALRLANQFLGTL